MGGRGDIADAREDGARRALQGERRGHEGVPVEAPFLGALAEGLIVVLMVLAAGLWDVVPAAVL